MASEIIKNLITALELSPDNIPLRIQVANLLMAEKEYDKAAEQFREVLNRSYGNIPAQTGLASCYYSQGKYSAAIIIYEQLHGQLAMPDQVLYVKCLIKENSLQQAREIYQQLVALNPGFTDEEI
ncbi:MAG TPA: tetratricopeptide repeat protein, partial [Chitinophagaceae bacterium]|nr:tetratricopeptide repeat protein [Chitinophagaceae bacterium]